MKDLLKNKRLVLIGSIVLVLVVLGLGFFLLSNRASDNSKNTDTTPTEIPIPTISAKDLDLTIEAGPLGRTVIVTVGNPEGITAIEYELSYTSEGDVPRGAIGQIDVNKKPVRAEITLGTCSDTCHYDKGVANIKVILKITKEDGNIYQAEASLDSLGEE